MEQRVQANRGAPLVGALFGSLLAFLALGPALRRGFLLSYDMVFVPQLGFSPRTLGIDGSVPRAVPNDAVVALISTVLPGDIVQKLVLVSVFVCFGLGMGLVLKQVPATVVAVAVGLWNPWVAQRLEVGHWGFLLGYAVLPWVVWAGQKCRLREQYAYTWLSVVMIFASLTGSTGVVLALVVLTGVLVGDSPRHFKPYFAAVGTAILVSATWWWPFLNASSRAADRAGVTAFAAKSDTPLGVIVSLATGGGSWNQASWYAERQSWLLVTCALILVVVSIASLYRFAEEGDGLRGLLWAGVFSLVLAALAALPGGREVMTLVVTHIPGAGLLRDSQKFAGPWMLAVSVGAGLLTQTLLSRVHSQKRATPWPAVVTAAIIPVVLMPSLVWGSGGSWQSVTYPDSYTETAQDLEHAEAGSVAVFPWIQYRRFAWNQNRIVLDPWNRLLDSDVIVNDGLPLRDGQIAGEDPRASAISQLLHRDEHVVPGLRALGVRHVIVLVDQPNQDVTPDRLRGASLVKQADGVQLWALGTPQNEAGEGATWSWLGWILAFCAPLLTLILALGETRKQKM